MTVTPTPAQFEVLLLCREGLAPVAPLVAPAGRPEVGGEPGSFCR